MQYLQLTDYFLVEDSIYALKVRNILIKMKCQTLLNDEVLIPHLEVMVLY